MGDWNPKANDIFLKAVDLSDVAERAKFVAAECAGDATLGQEVDALLTAHGQADGILENSPADALFQSLSTVPAIENVGSVIGPYKLLSVIGEGGMGTVYRAEQTSPVRRFVAVKVIKAGMDTRKVIARFEAERQALALMDHPNIAKVLDAGSTPTGRPYFVMELVDGVPITDYCDRQKLTPARRIELFLPVCRAIQHAHQKGIIHRDIKPTNVLVGIYDGEAIPKVIDFGIAKATARRPTDETDMTAFGAVVGTLQYMSPEQAVTGDQDVDTRSDVYSLGVLLYELLTGSTPVTKDSLRDAAMAEALRVIREKDPPRPSTRLSEAGTPASVAATRGTEPARLTGILRGELDWIVMTALEKDRARRYDSANGLAADLLRYQADEPVTAHPPSFGYRVTKTFRRHRAVVLTGAAMAALLIAGAGVSTWQAVRATREKNAGDVARRQAVANAERAELSAAAERSARDQAQQNLEHLTKANGILTGIFQDLDPQAAASGRSTIQQQLSERLVDASGQFDARSIPDAKLRGDALFTIGTTLSDLSHDKEAIGPLTRALTEYRSALGPESEPAVRASNRLALACVNAGEFDRGIEMQKEAVATAMRKSGDSSPAEITALSDLGNAYRIAGRYPDSLDTYLKAETIATAHVDPLDPLVINCVSNLGAAYLKSGSTAKAIPLMEQALAGARKSAGTDAPLALLMENNLATVYQEAGRFTDARPLLEHVLTRDQAMWGPNHHDTLNAMSNLSTVYQQLGMIDAAVGLEETVLRTCLDRDGPSHPMTIVAMGNLAMDYLDQGRPDSAVPLIETAYRTTRTLYGPDNPTTIQAESNLANAYVKAWRSSEAIPLLEDAVRRSTTALGPDHPGTLTIVDCLGLVYVDNGRIPDGIKTLKHGFERRLATLGPDHPSTLMSENNFGYALLKDSRPKQALPVYQEVVRRRAATLGSDHPLTNDTLIDLALIRLQLGDHDQALQDCATAAAAFRRFFAADPMARANKLQNVGKILFQGNCPSDAERYFLENLSIRNKTAPGAWQTYYADSLVGSSLAMQGRFDEAEPYLRKGYDGIYNGLRRIPPASRGVFVEATNWLASLYHRTDRESMADELIGRSDRLRNETSGAPIKRATDAGSAGPVGSPN